MTTLKPGRWVKIHEQGQANFETAENVMDITIGSSCWFGANVLVCPGVTIGDGCVIGAGSVVTKDIPANSFAAGNPARVIHPITAEDTIHNLFSELY